MVKTVAPPILVGIPATIPIVPQHIKYFKGSGPWLTTLVDRWEENHPELSPVIISPAYEKLEYQEGRRRVWPLTYLPPQDFSAWMRRERPNSNGEHNTAPWHPAGAERIDIQAPIQGFTTTGENDPYGLSSKASAQLFRAVTHATGFAIHWIPGLMGREEFDLLYPQHILWNVIAGADYLLKGRGVTTCHETCGRVGKKGDGGFAATHIRPYAKWVLDTSGAPVFAISKDVVNLLTKVEGGATLDPAQVVLERNPYNEVRFVVKPQFAKNKAAFLDWFRADAEHERDAGRITEERYRQELALIDSIPVNARWVTYVGGSREFKGIEQLLRSWAVYQQQRADRDQRDILIMVGDGLSQKQFANHVRALGIEEHVRFTGARDPQLPFIANLHNASDLFTMTSLAEGDGVVVKEALGSGTRVVVPNSGGPGEYVTEVMGHRVVSRDPALQTSLARGIELLSDPERHRIEWGNLNLSGPDIVRQFVHWRLYYDGKTAEDPGYKELLQIADAWEQPETLRLRENALRELRGEFVPADDRCYAQMLATVFRTFGGMDVEARDFARAYAEELGLPEAVRRRRGLEAQQETFAKFSSAPHAAKMAEHIAPIAARQIDPGLMTHRESGTVIEEFTRRPEVADAFEAMRKASTPEEGIVAIDAFYRSVMRVLGDPATYADRWPAVEELGLNVWDRSARIAARLAGVQLETYQDVRRRIVIDAARSSPEVQTAFYRIFIGDREGALRTLVEANAKQDAVGSNSL